MMVSLTQLRVTFKIKSFFLSGGKKMMGSTFFLIFFSIDPAGNPYLILPAGHTELKDKLYCKKRAKLSFLLFCRRDLKKKLNNAITSVIQQRTHHLIRLQQSKCCWSLSTGL